VDTLRGFGENRFYGDALLLLNAEVRVKVVRMRVFGVNAEFEVAPFVDIGKVFYSAEQFMDTRFEVTPGLGFRGLAPPSVVGHIEIAYSREGPAIYVGLDYPF
jgi:hemolysin activation/secretion protein